MRQGASRVFFDVMIRYQTARLIKDVKAQQVMLRAATLDTLSGIGDSMQGLVDITNAWTSQMVTLGIETGLARVEFEKFFSVMEDARMVEDQIISMGAGYGFGAEEALSAGARMAQLSTMFGPEAVPMGTQLGMTFGMIGGMGNEEAMKKMIQLQQQTNFMMGDFNQQQFSVLEAGQKLKIMHEETIRVMDALNSVENTSVAIMSQITDVMNNFAAQASLTGESIESMAAQSALLIEAGEEQGKAGRALRMIYARLGGNISGAADTLGQYVDVMDESTNTMRPLSEIMADLAPQWEAFSAAEKQAIAQSVSGNRHYVRFIKLMENHDRLLNLQKNAYDRLFPAEEERNRKLEDTAMRIKIINTEMENQDRILSERLMPAFEKQLSLRLAYKEVITSLINQESRGIAGIVGSLASAAIQLSEYMRIWSGFFNVYTGILSAKIALQGYSLVMKSMIAPLEQFYNMQNNARDINIQMTQHEIYQAHVLNTVEDVRAANKEKIAKLTQNTAALSQTLVAAEEKRDAMLKKIAESKEIIKNKGYADLSVAQSVQEREEAHLTQLRNRIELERTSSMLKADGRSQQMLNNDLARQETILLHEQRDLEKMILAIRAVRDNPASTKMTKAGITEIILALGNQKMKEEELMALKKEQLVQKFFELGLDEAVVTQAESNMDLTAKRIAQLMTLMEVEELERQAKLATAEAQKLVSQELQIGMEIAENLTITQSMLTMSEEQLQEALMQEFLALGFVNDERTKSVALQAAQRVETFRAAKGSREGAKEMSNLSGKMMAFNTSMMASSFLLSQFGSDTFKAKLQVMTMMATMGGMVVEMAKFAKETIKGANALRTFQMYSLAGTGLVVVMALLANKIMPKVAEEAKEIEDSMSSVALSFERINALYQESIDMSYADVQQEINDLRAEDLALAESMKNADEDMRQAYQERRDDIAIEIGENSRLLEIKRAQSQADTILNENNRERIEQMLTLARLPGFGEEKIEGDFLYDLFGQENITQRTQENREALDDYFMTLRDSVQTGLIDADKLFEGADMTYGRNEQIMNFLTGDMTPEEIEQQLSDWWSSGLGYSGAEPFYEQIFAGDSAVMDRLTNNMSKSVTSEWQETMDYIVDSGATGFDAVAILIESAMSFDNQAIVTGIEEPIRRAVGLMQDFENTRDELFFGGRTAALTGSLYRQVIQQGVGTLYNHQEVIVSSTNNFHGFFSIDEAAKKIGDAIDAHLEGRSLRIALGG